jgi:malonyl-CoA O-methyltransferase
MPSDPIASVQNGYDRWAAVYDHDGNPLQALEMPVMRTAVGDVRGLSVLDLGCGTGRHCAWLVEAGASVTALDFSEGMLAEARGKPGMATVRFIAHDLRQPLPLTAASFDRVISGLVLEHIADLKNFFTQIHTVLKPGGRAIISAMHPAMFLRGAQARFTDPASGELIQPGSIAHPIGAFAMAAVRARLQLVDISELAPDADLAARFPRAGKYVGWPMLVVLTLARSMKEPEPRSGKSTL